MTEGGASTHRPRGSGLGAAAGRGEAPEDETEAGWRPWHNLGVITDPAAGGAASESKAAGPARKEPPLQRSDFITTA